MVLLAAYSVGADEEEGTLVLQNRRDSIHPVIHGLLYQKLLVIGGDDFIVIPGCDEKQAVTLVLLQICA